MQEREKVVSRGWFTRVTATGVNQDVLLWKLPMNVSKTPVWKFVVITDALTFFWLTNTLALNTILTGLISEYCPACQCANAGSRLDGLHPSPDIRMLVLQEHSGPFQMGAVSVPSANAGTSGNLTVCQRDVLRWHLWPIKKTCWAARLKLQADACCNWPQPASVYTNMEIKAHAFDTWGQTLDMSSASRQAKKSVRNKVSLGLPLNETHRKTETSCLIMNSHLQELLPLVALEGNVPGVRSLEVGL